MAVVTNRPHPDTAYSHERCSLCEGKLSFPYISWGGKKKRVFFCRLCARGIKSGLIADLIHIAAIVDLQAVHPHYRDHTFKRTTPADLEAEHKAGECMGQMIME